MVVSDANSASGADATFLSLIPVVVYLSRSQNGQLAARPAAPPNTAQWRPPGLIAQSIKRRTAVERSAMGSPQNFVSSVARSIREVG